MRRSAPGPIGCRDCGCGSVDRFGLTASPAREGRVFVCGAVVGERGRARAGLGDMFLLQERRARARVRALLSTEGTVAQIRYLASWCEREDVAIVLSDGREIPAVQNKGTGRLYIRDGRGRPHTIDWRQHQDQEYLVLDSCLRFGDLEEAVAYLETLGGGADPLRAGCHCRTDRWAAGLRQRSRGGRPVSRSLSFFPAAGRTLSTAARAAYGLAVSQLGRPSEIRVSPADAELTWMREGRAVARIALRRDPGTGLWRLGDGQ